MRDPLSNYEAEARGIADELLDMLRHSRTMDIARKYAAEAINMTEDEKDAAFVLIGKPPSQRRSLEAKLTGTDERKVLEAVLLIVRAKFLITRGINAMRLATSMSYIPGSGYRAGARQAAEAADRSRLTPSLDNLFRSMS